MLATCSRLIACPTKTAFLISTASGLCLGRSMKHRMLVQDADCMQWDIRLRMNMNYQRVTTHAAALIQDTKACSFCDCLVKRHAGNCIVRGAKYKSILLAFKFPEAPYSRQYCEQNAKCTLLVKSVPIAYRTAVI